MITVGDVLDRLEWAWRTAIEKGDVVISTGGIGPTADDLTTETIARVAGVNCLAATSRRRDDEAHVRDDQSRDAREQSQAGGLSGGRNRHPESARHRAGFQVPVTDGIGGHIASSDRDAGVPREMTPMMGRTGDTVDRGKNRGTDQVYAVEIFQTFGMSESASRSRPWQDSSSRRRARSRFRASFPQISMKIAVEGEPGEVEHKLEELSERVREKISQLIYRRRRRLDGGSGRAVAHP